MNRIKYVGLIGICMIKMHAFTINSLDFANNGPIPKEFSGRGAPAPRLVWQHAPAATQSVALIVEDPDAHNQTWIHWVAYNIPPSLNALDRPLARTLLSYDGIAQGINSDNEIGYDGPNPPEADAPHHYHFIIYALDKKLALKPGATAAQLRAAIKGHIIAHAELVGTFARS